MVSIRLDPEMEKRLAILAKELHMSKSQIIKEALRYYLETKSPYELGKDLFGRYASGESDRSVTYKQRLKRKIGEKSHR